MSYETTLADARTAAGKPVRYLDVTELIGGRR